MRKNKPVYMLTQTLMFVFISFIIPFLVLDHIIKKEHTGW